jgi:hypothetical protein
MILTMRSISGEACNINRLVFVMDTVLFEVRVQVLYTI